MTYLFELIRGACYRDVLSNSNNNNNNEPSERSSLQALLANLTKREQDQLRQRYYARKLFIDDWIETTGQHGAQHYVDDSLLTLDYIKEVLGL